MKAYKILAVALALCMVLGLGAFAAGGEEDLSLSINGMDFGAISVEGDSVDGSLRFNLGKLLSSLGVSISYDEEKGLLTLDAGSGLVAQLLGGLVGAEIAEVEEASAEPASEEPASEEPAAEPAAEEEYPGFAEYKEYLYETLMQDSFWQGNEGNLTAALEAATSPDDESIANFTGSGDVDQAPDGVVFPMTYEAWYAENGGAAGEDGAYPHFDEFRDYVAEYALADDFMASQDGIPEDIYAAETPYVAPFCDINSVIGALDYPDWMAENYAGESFPTE